MRIFKITFIVFSILIFISASASADVIPPDRKAINWSYKISNINDFPANVFLLYEHTSNTYKILNDDESFRFYKLSDVTIFTMPESEFDQEELEKYKQEEIEEFFSENPSLIASDIKLSPEDTVEIGDPLKEAEYVLRINSISEDNLEIVEEKTIYTYEDGTEEIIKHNQEDKDLDVEGEEGNNEDEADEKESVKKENNNFLPSWFIILFFACLPVLAIVIIILILLIRRIKK